MVLIDPFHKIDLLLTLRNANFALRKKIDWSPRHDMNYRAEANELI